MIRPYDNLDLDQLLKVWSEASAVAHPFLTSEFLAAERDNIQNVYLPNAETWVYELAGGVVAFISLIGNEVGGLFVDPEYQRRGIGQRLMDKARSLRGELEVEVFLANRIGRAFYDQCGFEPVLQRIHEPTGQHVLRLRLPVAGVAS